MVREDCGNFVCVLLIGGWPTFDDANILGDSLDIAPYRSARVRKGNASEGCAKIYTEYKLRRRVKIHKR